MQLIKEMNIVTDKKIRWHMNILSVGILVATAILTYLIAGLFSEDFILISSMIILLMILGIGGQMTILLFIFHTSGCAGDFLYIYEIMKNKQISHIEDTPTGIKFFSQTI